MNETLPTQTSTVGEGYDLELDFFDEELASTGVWVPFRGNSKIKIASLNNDKHQAARMKAAKQHRLQLDDQNPSASALVLKITCDCLARHVLLDWEGIKLGGKFVPYTVEVGFQALMKSEPLREFVTEQAGRPSVFQSGRDEPVQELLAL